MSDLNGQAIFDALKSTTPVPEETEPMIHFICDAAPAILATVLEQPFDLKHYAEAKLLYLRWMLENEDFLAKFGETLDDLTWGMWRSLYDNLISQLEAMVEDTDGFMKTTGMTDDLLAQKMELNAILIAKHEAGTLTIGDLLQYQPGLLLDNTK